MRCSLTGAPGRPTEGQRGRWGKGPTHLCHVTGRGSGVLGHLGSTPQKCLLVNVATGRAFHLPSPMHKAKQHGWPPLCDVCDHLERPMHRPPPDQWVTQACSQTILNLALPNRNEGFGQTLTPSGNKFAAKWFSSPNKKPLEAMTQGEKKKVRDELVSIGVESLPFRPVKAVNLQ